MDKDQGRVRQLIDRFVPQFLLLLVDVVVGSKTKIQADSGW